MSKIIDIKGQTFGALHALEYVGCMKGNASH